MPQGSHQLLHAFSHLFCLCGSKPKARLTYIPFIGFFQSAKFIALSLMLPLSIFFPVPQCKLLSCPFFHIGTERFLRKFTVQKLLQQRLSVGNMTLSGMKEALRGTVSPTGNESWKGSGFVSGKSLGNF